MAIEAIATLDGLSSRLGAELARGAGAGIGEDIALRAVEWLLGAPEGTLDAAIHGLLVDIMGSAGEGGGNIWNQHGGVCAGVR